MQIIVPDIEYFNNTFEKNWLRPGINIQIEFGHSVRMGESANRGVYTGKITSFSFDIQENATVAVSIQAKANTELFTEILAAKSGSDQDATDSSAESAGIVGIARKWFEMHLPEAVAGGAYYLNGNDITKPFSTDILSDEALANTMGISIDELYKQLEPQANQYRYITALKFNEKYIQYISLGLLIELLNQFIASTWSGIINPTPSFTVSPVWSKTDYLENLVSSDPERIILPGQDNYYTLGNTSTEDTITESVVTPYDEWIKTLKENTQLSTRDLKFYKTDKTGLQFGIPASILISIDAIEEIFNKSTVDQKEKTSEERDAVNISITTLVNNVSNLIYTSTGNAIDLQFARHPNVNSTDAEMAKAAESVLILRDANYVDTTTNVEPYVFPLFTNTKRGETYLNAGSLLRAFKISARIPDSLKTVAMVFSQSTGDSLQGYLNYQYAEPAEKEKILEESKTLHESAKTALKKSISNFNNTVNEDTKKDLNIKLLQYVGTPTISNSISPLWPLTIDFEMDGIYGLRFGDVLQFEPLPTAYQQNAVFIIYKIQHIIADNDWKTKITCLMRTKA